MVEFEFTDAHGPALQAVTERAVARLRELLAEAFPEVDDIDRSSACLAVCTYMIADVLVTAFGPEEVKANMLDILRQVSRQTCEATLALAFLAQADALAKTFKDA